MNLEPRARGREKCRGLHHVSVLFVGLSAACRELQWPEWLAGVVSLGVDGAVKLWCTLNSFSASLLRW